MPTALVETRFIASPKRRFREHPVFALASGPRRLEIAAIQTFARLRGLKKEAGKLSYVGRKAGIQKWDAPSIYRVSTPALPNMIQLLPCLAHNFLLRRKFILFLTKCRQRGCRGDSTLPSPALILGSVIAIHNYLLYSFGYLSMPSSNYQLAIRA